MFIYLTLNVNVLNLLKSPRYELKVALILIISFLHKVQHFSSKILFIFILNFRT